MLNVAVFVGVNALEDRLGLRVVVRSVELGEAEVATARASGRPGVVRVQDLPFGAPIVTSDRVWGQVCAPSLCCHDTRIPYAPARTDPCRNRRWVFTARRTHRTMAGTACHRRKARSVGGG